MLMFPEQKDVILVLQATPGKLQNMNLANIEISYCAIRKSGAVSEKLEKLL